ncbi:MAG: type I-C CRISPR-associated protein Cas8c/Csd1, partial [Ktedonobacterales bacterium]|nr:type I-C CRISPR-associated protein Cas8c/Csd1 [Ktedonobacterales bacterium]
MLLQRLREYAERLDDLPPAMYQRVPIRYLLLLDEAGRYRGYVHHVAGEAARDQRGIRLLVPDRKRTVAVAPKLLADNAEYVLGLARPESDAER